MLSFPASIRMCESALRSSPLCPLILGYRQKKNWTRTFVSTIIVDLGCELKIINICVARLQCFFQNALLANNKPLRKSILGSIVFSHKCVSFSKDLSNFIPGFCGAGLKSKLRGHAQTMWKAMRGGGISEMSTLLIKLSTKVHVVCVWLYDP